MSDEPEEPEAPREPATPFTWVIIAAVVLWGLGAVMIIVFLMNRGS